MGFEGWWQAEGLPPPFRQHWSGASSRRTPLGGPEKGIIAGMETNNDRAEEIRAGLGAALTVRQEALDHLADATATYEAAGTAFTASFDQAIKAGWTESELGKFGIKRVPGSTARARKPRKTPRCEAPVNIEANEHAVP